jgi:hypothetical protein
MVQDFGPTWKISHGSLHREYKPTEKSTGK